MRNHNEGQSAPAKQRADQSAQRRPKPVLGTGTQENIQVVRTKLLSVLAVMLTVKILSLRVTDTAHLKCALNAMTLWRCITRSSGLKALFCGCWLYQ